MQRNRTTILAATSALALAAGGAAAEQPALVLHATKGADQSQRQDGIAFVELDPTSAQIALPPEFHSH